MQKITKRRSRLLSSLKITTRCSAFPKNLLVYTPSSMRRVLEPRPSRRRPQKKKKKGESKIPDDGLCGQSPSPVPFPENFGIILTYNPSPPRRQHVGSTTYVALCISSFTLDMFIRYGNLTEIVFVQTTRYRNIKKTCSSHRLITNSIEQKIQRERVETTHRLGVPAESLYVKLTQPQ